MLLRETLCQSTRAILLPYSHFLFSLSVCVFLCLSILLLHCFLFVPYSWLLSEDTLTPIFFVVAAVAAAANNIYSISMNVRSSWILNARADAMSIDQSVELAEFACNGWHLPLTVSQVCACVRDTDWECVSMYVCTVCWYPRRGDIDMKVKLKSYNYTTLELFFLLVRFFLLFLTF